MTQHTRLRAGQIWRANRTDYLRAIRIIALEPGNGPRVLVADVLTRRRSFHLDRAKFTTGVRGWALVKDVAR